MKVQCQHARHLIVPDRLDRESSEQSLAIVGVKAGAAMKPAHKGSAIGDALPAAEPAGASKDCHTKERNHPTSTKPVERRINPTPLKKHSP
eukprot:5296413-Amphidinium_carterae.1